jgi:DNA (cytosine-5)-methyltransferase 1
VELMERNNKISIQEFDNKGFNLKTVEPFDKAIITHYLHNYRNGLSKHYKSDAVKVLKKFVE